MPTFTDLPIWLNLAIFGASAAAVWFAGTRLAGYVDGIAGRTGIGQGFAGLLLLGGITSLPEMATVATSSYTGNAPLALNNLLGSAAINVVLLAIGDAVLGRDALTSVVGKPSTLVQGSLGILVLTLVAMAVTTGDVAVGGVGLWSITLLACCVGALWMTSHYERRHVWTAVEGPGEESAAGQDEEATPSDAQAPLRALIAKTIGVAVIILIAGFLLSQTGDALAEQSGVGASLTGLVLVGFATSLPELSSITAALRLKRYEMAIGDIFGTNLFNVGLIFVADLLYAGAPVLSGAGPFEAVASMLAVVLTALVLLGLLERKNRTVLRMGYDSLAVLVAFASGLALLYRLAPAN